MRSWPPLRAAVLRPTARVPCTRRTSTSERAKGGRFRQQSRQIPASGETNWREGRKLLELSRLQRPLWIRRVLVRAQEGQLEAAIRLRTASGLPMGPVFCWVRVLIRGAAAACHVRSSRIQTGRRRAVDAGAAGADVVRLGALVVLLASLIVLGRDAASRSGAVRRLESTGFSAGVDEPEGATVEESLAPPAEARRHRRAPPPRSSSKRRPARTALR
jgi:hypothetical protein